MKLYSVVEDEVFAFFIGDEYETIREIQEVWDLDEEGAREYWENTPKVNLDPDLVERYKDAFLQFLSVKRELKREIEKEKQNGN